MSSPSPLPAAPAAFGPLELQGLWQCLQPDGSPGPALAHPWGPRHRPDWLARGLVVWPRGGQWWELRLRLALPEAWRRLGPGAARARLALRWWADAAELWVDGACVHRGDLFDTACRWELPARCWDGVPLELLLRLRSPRHDDGALIHSRLVLEPTDPADPHGLLAAEAAELVALRLQHGHGEAPGPGALWLLGHAHLDLAWLWPVADTWQAAERTFRSALDLIERYDDLHFAHSTPALYAWLEQHRPALFARIRTAMRQGRWEPLNGPWVESDCVLIDTASLLRQFQQGQHYSRRTFPEWEHRLAWLPDSFGFAAGLPAVAAATGVDWFCTHKLAWNATNPFPHRLFRWRSRCGAEVLALMTAPIGTDADPLAMERYRLEWQAASGCADALWLPGVGDHGGGPTAEMLEQLALWQGQPLAAAQRHGSLRAYLAALVPLAAQLPVWRDELYLELHRGCATSRPDQKRHNRSLERLLREAELARCLPSARSAAAPAAVPAALQAAGESVDWRPLLFQQFHDILPGTSIPEVFEQAGPQWCAARRRAREQRDRALMAALPAARAGSWWAVQLQPDLPAPRTVRLPEGRWCLTTAAGERPLPQQLAPGGGCWVQLPGLAGLAALPIRRLAPGTTAAAAASPEASILQPVELQPEPEPGRWRLSNGLMALTIGAQGVEQVWDQAGRALLAAPLGWRRWADRGEFWDAWDIAADYRSHPLPWQWEGAPEWVERGPLCCRFLWRGRCGGSAVRLDGRLLAGSAALELVLSVDWCQRHELLQLELPLANPAIRWAADTAAGVIERPARAVTPREQARWEVPAVSWLASVAGTGGGLALLLDGPQGVSASPEHLGVSLLRAPTWPDPGADNGWQRQRLALMVCEAGWRPDGVPRQARRLREPLWIRPAPEPHGAAAADPRSWFPPLAADLRLVGLRPLEDGSGDVVLTLQNLGPCRRRLELSGGWCLRGRLDGLDQPLETGGNAAKFLDDPLLIRPWQLAFWRLGRPPAAP
jgi:alpha-mannosidase